MNANITPHHAGIAPNKPRQITSQRENAVRRISLKEGFFDDSLRWLTWKIRQLKFAFSRTLAGMHNSPAARAELCFVFQHRKNRMGLALPSRSVAQLPTPFQYAATRPGMFHRGKSIPPYIHRAIPPFQNNDFLINQAPECLRIRRQIGLRRRTQRFGTTIACLWSTLFRCLLKQGAVFTLSNGKKMNQADQTGESQNASSTDSTDTLGEKIEQSVQAEDRPMGEVEPSSPMLLTGAMYPIILAIVLLSAVAFILFRSTSGSSPMEPPATVDGPDQQVSEENPVID